ncbi:MAG: hypothetical protein K0U12_05800, partial [Gammaproteobacteria bacterium]|nr:hypothetical protein [Gammaproteobacteria bacterium]
MSDGHSCNEKRSFIILGGGELPWIYPLGVELGKFAYVTVIQIGVSFLGGFRKEKWPFDTKHKNFKRVAWTYPPGFNGKLSAIFEIPIRLRLKLLIRNYYKLTGETPYIIMPNPRYYPYIKGIAPQKLVYLNYDDYSKDCGVLGYIPLPEEKMLINRVNTAFCCSQYQVIQFKRRFKKMNSRIFHLPHGANDLYLNLEPNKFDLTNTVCTTGFLSSRYNWNLIYRVAARLLEIQFLFVGNIVKTKL